MKTQILYCKFFKVNIVLFLISLFLLSNIYAAQPDSTWLKDISHEVGLDSVRGSRIWIADINGDNFPDLLWGDGGMIKNKLHIYLNVPNPDKTSEFKRIFINYTDSSGINVNRDAGKTGRVVDIAAVADVNNDGYPDIVTSIYYHRLQYYADTLDPGDRSEVYLNDGKGHFTLYPNNGLYQLGLVNTTGLAFLDYDLDGNLDLFMGQWFYDYLNDIKQTSYLMKGKGDGSFTQVFDEAINAVAEPFYGANVTDWDNDGWQDIITSPYCRSTGNLYKNRGNGTFYDVAAGVGYTSQLMGGDNGQDLCQWAANPADFNNDGNMDLLQVEVHGGYNGGEGRTHIAVNLGPDSNYNYRWELDRLKRDAPTNSHLGDQGGTWFDLDGDGKLDVAICQMAYPAANTAGQERLYILLQNEQGYFDDISRKLGIFYPDKEAHTASPADFDLDGDQDLFFSRQHRDTTIVDTVIDGQTKKDTSISVYYRIHLLRNDIGNKNNWISVKLIAPEGCNKSCIGARITTYTGNVQQIREIQAGVGHFATQQPFIQNFSLGSSNHVDSIKIRYPMPEFPVTTIYNPAINLVHEFKKDGSDSIINTWSQPEPIISIIEPNLDFDTVNVGQIKEMNFTVKNVGDAPLLVSNISVENSIDTAFIYTNENVPPFEFALQPNETHNVKIRFQPKIRAYFQGTVILNSNAVNASKKSFDVSGYGFEPKPLISIQDTSLTFDNVFVDSTINKDFIVKNAGEQNLEFQSFILNDTTGTFKLSNTNLPRSLSPGESFPMHISFTPVEMKTYSANISILSDAYNSPKITINLTGICNGPKPVISTGFLILSVGSTEVGQHLDKAFNINNAGSGYLVIKSITTEKYMDSIFTFPDLNLPLQIMSNDSARVTIRFSPLEAKSYSTKLIIASNSYQDTLKKYLLNASGIITSIEEYTSNTSNIVLKVFPNPVIDSKITVLCNRYNLSYDNVPINLYNMEGLEVKKIGILKSGMEYLETDADVGDLSSGMYFIHATSSSGIVQVPFIILK